MPTAEQKNTQLAEIERSIANIDAIGASGADRDGAFTVMAKGLVNGFNALLDMVKGKKAPPPVDGDPEDGAGGSDPEDGDPEDEDKDKPGEAGGGGGFADMRMGQEGDPDMVDATQYILSLEKAVRDQRGEIAGLTKLVKRQGAQIDRLDGRLTELGTGLAATLAPLSKGMLDVHSAIARLPAGSVSTPGLDGNRAAVRHAVTAAASAGADSNRKQLEPKLLKAVNARIINDQDLTIWRRTGRLRDVDAENDALIAKIKAL